MGFPWGWGTGPPPQMGLGWWGGQTQGSPWGWGVGGPPRLVQPPPPNWGLGWEGGEPQGAHGVGVGGLPPSDPPTPISPPAPPSRLLALLHEDLHPPGLLRALGAMASTQLTLGGSPSPPRLVSVLSCPRKGGVRRKVGEWGGDGGTIRGAPPMPPQILPLPQDESFTLLPDGSLRSLGGAPPPALEEEGGPRMTASSGDFGGPPPRPLTFRLRLSAAERAARAAVPPPYQLSSPR